MPSDAVTLRRQLKQTLESLQRAGLTHLPRGIIKPEPVAQQSQPARIVTQQEPSVESDETETSVLEVSGIKKSAPMPVLSRSDRCAHLAELAGKVAACTRCQELADTRTQTVFGVGNPEARIVFIGEAPGADEDKQGEPFVGRAGQLLNKIIEASQLKREEIYICNVLKCRPPGNRTPDADEAANCREYLEGQLSTIDPEYIVCWGTVAAQNLLASTTSIGKLRGTFFQFGRAKVVCTYHPSYLLRNPAAKKDVWEDMKFLMRDMGVELN